MHMYVSTVKSLFQLKMPFRNEMGEGFTQTPPHPLLGSSCGSKTPWLSGIVQLVEFPPLLEWRDIHLIGSAV